MSARTERIKQQLIKDVQALAKELGRTPLKKEFKGRYQADYRFGTWTNFLKEAGLKLNLALNDFDNLSDDELLSIVKKEFERIGATTYRGYNKYKSDDAPSNSYILNRLGLTWNELLRKLDIKVNFENKTDDELLDLLRGVAEELGKAPTVNDLESRGISPKPYKSRFGSYNNAVVCAGLEVNTEQCEVTHTKEELLEMYINLCKELGDAATTTDIDNRLPYSSSVFITRFGGMDGLRKLAGYDEKKRAKKYDKKMITDILIEKYAEKERRLTHNEIKQLSMQYNDFPALGTICKYFKTTKMTEVWEEIEKSSELKLVLYDKGLNDSAIADAIGISQEAVSAWRRRRGLPINKKKRKLTTDDRMDLYKQGLTDEEIAERLGLGTLTITLWRTQQGLKTNGIFSTEMSSAPIDPPPSGRNQHNKATDNRMELYQQGLTDAEIAKAIGKSEKAILSWRYANRLAANRPPTTD